ncbi:MAG TPA: alpha/beta hydrolase [Anaerolineales bacterium]|nr:alpha/beta hydrolase [Anaerolineales bacterium]
MSTLLSVEAGKKDQHILSDLQHTSRRNWFKRGLLSLLILILFLPASGAAYQFLATRSDQRTYLPDGQLTNVGGYMLHIHCTGQGSPTVLLEGGLGGTSLDWSLVQPELSADTRVCSYDRAGLGWSEHNPSGAPRTSSQIVQELHTLLASTGIEGPYILAGLSAGGMHVQMFADRYPDEVLGMVLVDPTPASLMASFSDEQRRPLLPNLDQIEVIQRLEPFGLLRLLPLPGSEALANLPEQTQQAIRAVNVRTGAAAALYQEAAGFEASILETASLPPLPVELPLTVIWHGNPAEPLELEPKAEGSLRELVADSDYGRFVTAEGSGHYITLDRPDIVIEELRSILATVRMQHQIDIAPTPAQLIEQTKP